MAGRSSYFPETASGKVPQLTDVAQLIKGGYAKKIGIMAGAGISTAAGIPDFRSPETGLYANLEKYNLPYPEAIFDIDYFLKKPQPFFTLAKELYPGQFAPTKTHWFFRLLQDKGILSSLWTQNIDTMERMAGIEPEKLIEAHGSFASAECLRCKKEFTKEAIEKQVLDGEVVRCDEKSCKGKKDALVKPVITFFGESMPTRFFKKMPELGKVDLLLVLGTSLSVHPFASLVDRVPRACPRVLINLEKVGPFQVQKGGRDVRHLGGCDDAVDLLVKELGWQDEFDALLAAAKVGKKTAGVAAGEAKEATEVDDLAKAVSEVALDKEPEGEVKPAENSDPVGAESSAELDSGKTVGDAGKL